MLLLTSAPAAAAQDDAALSKPNVVLIVIDALRLDRLTANRDGRALMPQTLAFAQRSWQYTQAYSQETWTKPSVTSILTSLYPEVHGVQYGGVVVIGGPAPAWDALPAGLETIATLFRKQGYATIAVQTNPNLSPRLGFDRDFEKYHMLGDTPSPAVNEVVLKEIQDAERPFFLYVHYTDPHAPYSPPPAYQFAVGQAPVIQDWERDLLSDYFPGYYRDLLMRRVAPETPRSVPSFDETGRSYIRYLYDGEVLCVDDQIGVLLRALESASRPSVIVVTSDHGEEFWEHGSVGHGKTAYAELARVPLIIHLPDKDPKQVGSPVEAIDILPTLAAYLGLPAEPNWQGHNLLAQGDGPEDASRAVYTSAHWIVSEAHIRCESVCDGHFRLVVDRAKGSAQLFDATQDPGEKTDLVRDEPARAQELEAFLDGHNAANLAHPCRTNAPSTVTADDDLQQQLRALGYLP